MTSPSAGAGPTPDLSAAVDALVRVAERAGLDADAVRKEGADVAAAVAESASGAAHAWVAELGGTLQTFFDAAVRARRYRGAPTPGLAALVVAGSPVAADYARALVEIAAAATGLGTPSARVAENAAVVAAAQLAAAGAGSGPGWDRLADPSAGLRPDPSRQAVAPAPAAPAAPAVPAQPEEPVKSLDELLAELDDLTGLREVKSEIHRQSQLLRIEKLRAEAGLRSPTITRHLVFLGNPGTGKTTVARLVAGIYRAIGLLDKGQLVEVDRSELVAGYLGQTATKTAEVVASAIGGVLFVDEAYSLAGDQYGEEAIDTLVKEMEDHRDDLVVVVAGYPQPMQEFIATNPGLASRFRTVITFADYADDELVDIFSRLAEDADYAAGQGCRERFREILATTARGQGFGNGRFARNVLEAAIGRHAWRLRDVEAPTVQQLRELVPEDLSDVDTSSAHADAGSDEGDEGDVMDVMGDLMGPGRLDLLLGEQIPGTPAPGAVVADPASGPGEPEATS